MRCWLLLGAISCGGSPTATKESPRTPVLPGQAACTDRALTIDRDVIGLVVARKGAVWIEHDGGRIAAAGEVLHASTPGEEGQALSILGDRMVWAHYDGTIWTRTGKVATIPSVVGIAATADAIVVANSEGIFKVPWAGGDPEEVFAGPIWTMTVDGEVAYVQSQAKLLRVPLDGEPAVMLADNVPKLSSITLHDGKVFAISRPDVLVVEGQALVPVVTYEVRHSMWHLRSANGHLYFVVGNVVYQLRDRTPVPVAIASEAIGDLAIDGEVIYTSSRDTGVHAHCHAIDGEPIALPPPAKRECPAGLTLSEYPTLDLVQCKDPAGAIVASRGFHRSGTRWSELRDHVETTYYADGTLRSEEPDKAGVIKRYFVTGALRAEGPSDDDTAMHGTWRYYDATGKLRDTIEWDHGTKR